MIQAYKWNGTVINFDNAYYAAKFASDNPDAVAMTDDEIAEIFGDYAYDAGPHNTTVDDDGNITFDSTEAVARVAAATLREGKAIVEESFTDTCDGGVVFNNTTYRCRQEDMRLMEEALAVAKRTGQETVNVRALDYTWRNLSIADYEELCNLVAATYFQAYEEYSLSLNELYS
jgi:hypothetical protein